jgi:hypothetical protein
MSKLTAIAGYTLAVLAMVVVLATFIGMNFWADKLVAVTGLKVSPWFTGGEVVRTIDHGSYQTRIHRAVFDGLVSEYSQGFIQVDWTPLEALPATIDEVIDINDDGQQVFRIELDTRSGLANLTASNHQVLGLKGTYKLKKAWAVRVLLSNAP